MTEQMNDALKQAAEEFDDSMYRSDCFIGGANWYLNNVWHDVSEEHDKKQKIACLQRNGHIITGLFNEVPAPFEMWAYTDDLLPNKQED